MQNSYPLVWPEGLLIQQQHFQQWQQYFVDQIWQRQTLYNSFAWGVVQLEYDVVAVREGIFRLTFCRVVFQNGELVAYQHDEQHPLLCKLDQNENRQDIYLVMPNNAYVSGVRGYSDPEVRAARHVVFAEVADQLDATRLQEIMLAKPNLQLMLEQPETDFYSIKIAEIIRPEFGELSVNQQYSPPCVAVNSAVGLIQAMKQFTALLQSKCMQLQVDTSIHQSQQNDVVYVTKTRHLRQLLMQYYAKIIGFKQMNHVAPMHLYQVLVEIVMELSGVLGLAIPKVPNYDHVQLSDVFTALFHSIESMLGSIHHAKVANLPLTKQSPLIYTLENIADLNVCEGDCYLGVKVEALKAWMNEFMRQTKIASGSDIDTIVSLALPAIGLAWVQKPECYFVPKPDFQYFALQTRGEGWQRVLDHNSLTVFLTNDFSNATLELIHVQQRERQEERR